jgi:hypothetical protein
VDASVALSPVALARGTEFANADIYGVVGDHLSREHLRFGSPGRLLGHVADDKDMFDMIDFGLEASELLRAKVTLFSDGVLSHLNVSTDLADATSL